MAGCYLLFAGGCFGQGVHLESAGGRFGFYPMDAGRDFHQAEVFVNWDLPWAWDLGSLWRLESRVDVSGGWLGESRVDAAIFTAGPSLVLRRGHLPFTFEAGLSPIILTRSDFRTKDLGTLFQFTSHAGLNLDVGSHVRFSYRFQHMSSAVSRPTEPWTELAHAGAELPVLSVFFGPRPRPRPKVV
jgi:hypothetical protein